MRYNTVGVFRYNECRRCDGTGQAHKDNVSFECPDCGGRGDTTTPVCEYCFKDCILVQQHPTTYGGYHYQAWTCPDRANGFACGDESSQRPHDICPECLSHSHATRGWSNTFTCNHCGNEF